MRKFIFTFLILLIFNSCKSQESLRNVPVTFQVENSNDNLVKLKKNIATVISDGVNETESGYTIIVPKDIKDYSVSINVIPNEIVMEFNHKQKIFITKNYSSIKEKTLIGLNKNEFISNLIKLNVSSMKLDSELKTLKKDRLFGIRIINEYLVIYINVKSYKKEQFDKTLESFELK
ncbi:hypothetical protein NAT51_19465 [Flavobacterium amniphilum]|uniref:hypothetical protein n=1 Tax=Flavobacterium amniphilum TaxID=1834035 RepID=UPI00202A99DB|nr:hypothetical protein [Flavobacterium amniphilum]MCL9807706.1 hypothetical protein [Flavobacterium amniphilum]